MQTNLILNRRLKNGTPGIFMIVDVCYFVICDVVYK